MELRNYFKFILFFIYFSGSTHNQVDVKSRNETMPSELDLLSDPHDTKGVSGEMLYIVWVLAIWDTSLGKAYRETACTGTLLRDDIVLTLASCVLYDYNEDPDPNAIIVFERPRGQRLPALKVYINPNFYLQEKYLSNTQDFALIVVEKTKQTVFPRLAKGSDVFNIKTDSCIMGGYGTQTKRVLKENFKVFAMNETNIEVFMGRACVGGMKICLHFVDIMPCKADFGTPLICDGVVYALYAPRRIHHRSLTTKCLDIYITMFELVKNVHVWISDIMDDPTSNLEWLSNPWYVLLLCCGVFTMMGAIYYGLVEFLQSTFDPVGEEQQLPLPVEEDKEDEDSWYENSWITRS